MIAKDKDGNVVVSGSAKSNATLHKLLGGAISPYVWICKSSLSGLGVRHLHHFLNQS